MPRQYFYKENIFNYAVLIDLSIPVSYFLKKKKTTKYFKPNNREKLPSTNRGFLAHAQIYNQVIFIWGSGQVAPLNCAAAS